MLVCRYRRVLGHIRLLVRGETPVAVPRPQEFFERIELQCSDGGPIFVYSPELCPTISGRGWRTSRDEDASVVLLHIKYILNSQFCTGKLYIVRASTIFCSKSILRTVAVSRLGLLADLFFLLAHSYGYGLHLTPKLFSECYWQYHG